MRLVEDDETLRSVERNDPEEGEIKMPETNQMRDLGMWVHAKPNILFNGRTAHLDPEEPAEMPEGEEFDPEEAKKQLEAADPFEPRLKQLTMDQRVKVSASMKVCPWNIRCMGDQTMYSDEKDPKVTVSNNVVIVRSMIWPGSCSLYYKGRVLQIYLGNGQKNTHPQSMFPVEPPTVLDDPEEYGEGPEPTPLHAPPPPEENKDDEDKKEDEEESDD